MDSRAPRGRDHRLARNQHGNMSRPSRARGLKPSHTGRPLNKAMVAPIAGAWIETVMANLYANRERRAHRGRASHSTRHTCADCGRLDGLLGYE